MSSQSEFRHGAWVVFTDEYGKERVSKVLQVEDDGDVRIDGDHGAYYRKPGLVRLAEDWEVHKSELDGGYLR